MFAVMPVYAAGSAIRFDSVPAEIPGLPLPSTPFVYSALWGRIGDEADLAHAGLLRSGHGLGYALVAHVFVTPNVQVGLIFFARSRA